MPVEIIVRPTLGSYTARAKGHKGTASRSEGARQAAGALLFKLNLGAGKLQEQPSTDLPYGQQRFYFVSDSEMTECQFHNHCGGWCETQRELEHNLCEHCLEAHAEEMEQPATQQNDVLATWSPVKPTAPGAYWIRGNGLSRPALIEVIHEHGQLRCNLHDRTTCDDFGFGYSIEQLSDEFEFCGPLYTHPTPADPGEVERMQAMVELAESEALSAMIERDQLLDRLAELEALLRDFAQFEVGENGQDAWQDLLSQSSLLLSTSAEPSEPVERDERAAFEASYAREFSKARGQDLTAEDIASMRDSSGGYGARAYLNGQWAGWQARAALEAQA